MSASKSQRLINLTMCLMASGRYLSRADLRRLVPGYDDSDQGEAALVAFERMFERDKKELRELGVPIDSGPAHDGVEGYRIHPKTYALPDLSFTAEEAAALGLAARLWDSAELAKAGESAATKLAAAGVAISAPPPGFSPRVDAREPAFEACRAAVQSRQAVAFAYRGGRDDVARPRRVEPWGLVSWRGRWYLVGHDLDRQERRVFRLSRVSGPVTAVGDPGSVVVPPHDSLAESVRSFAEGEPRGTAVIRVRPGAARALCRTGTVEPGPDGEWDRLEVQYADPASLAARLVAEGPDVVVESPPELREAVLQRLRDLVGA